MADSFLQKRPECKNILLYSALDNRVEIKHREGWGAIPLQTLLAEHFGFLSS